ncbi:MAG: hypothetical protein ACI4JK_05350 [Oscillospiraceae bacterium]
MKLDKIYSLFRKSYKLILFNCKEKDLDGETYISKQYLNDGYCCYALDENLPTFSESAIAALIGCSSDDISVESKEQNNYIKEMMSDSYNASDQLLQIEPYSFFNKVVLSTSDGDCVLFVDPKYIKPFGNSDEISYQLRIVEGKQIIVVKNGMFTVAAITPIVFDDVLLNNMLCSTAKIHRVLTDQRERQKSK